MADFSKRRPSLMALGGLCLMVAAVPAAELQVAETRPLGFGSFTAGDGSVTVSPSSMRTTTGSVVPLTAQPGQAAQFVVSGDPDMAYAITLPADGTVFLDNGSASMPVTGFTSQPASAGVLPGTGSQALSVGATLDVDANQAPGTYSGTFNVTVDYN